MGLISTGGKLVATGLIAAAGFYCGVKYDNNYRIKTEVSSINCPYTLSTGEKGWGVTEKLTNETQPVTRDFQLGSIEYRLEGIVREAPSARQEMLHWLGADKI